MKLYAVIMAGGSGTRFWPRSRAQKPKQLLKIFGERTMIQTTVDRLEGLIPADRILIITNRLHREEIINQLPSLPPDNIIAEPVGRNTAPCVMLAAKIIQGFEPDAVTVVLPADHLIREKDNFQATLLKAAEYAYSEKRLMTIGIVPTRPETGYGYIQVDESGADRIYPVKSFAEKPNYSTALRFLESGDFYWNSGMFIWRNDVILEEMEMFLPEMNNQFTQLKFDGGFPTEQSLSGVFSEVTPISIDYGVMEKSRRVSLITSDFNWSDVGSWEEVYQLGEKDEEANSVTGNVFSYNTTGSYIYSPDKFTAVIGADNLIVINTADALLVCRRDKAQDVKKAVDFLNSSGQKEVL